MIYFLFIEFGKFGLWFSSFLIFLGFIYFRSRNCRVRVTLLPWQYYKRWFILLRVRNPLLTERRTRGWRRGGAQQTVRRPGTPDGRTRLSSRAAAALSTPSSPLASQLSPRSSFPASLLSVSSLADVGNGHLLSTSHVI